MHGSLPIEDSPAISGAAESVSKTADIAAECVAKSVSDSWFVDVCRDVLGKDAGAQLHLFTGISERNCYRYASGKHAPSPEFLRILFHSEHGQPFHDAFMAGCKARWWFDRQRKLRNADKVDAVRFE